jgi:hypothetical protein
MSRMKRLPILIILCLSLLEFNQEKTRNKESEILRIENNLKSSKYKYYIWSGHVKKIKTQSRV